MHIRLHEIEMGAASATASTTFLSSILGLPVKLQENTLTVFDSGIKGLDLNVSDHLSAGTTRISFLTDDLQGFVQRLKEQAVTYEGPYESHLGMLVCSVYVARWNSDSN